MKQEENKRTNQTSETSDFLQDKKEADLLFHNIMTGLDLDPSCVSHSHCNKYRSRFIRHYLMKGVAAVFIIGLLAIGGSGLLQTPSISSVLAAPSSDSSSIRVTFRVDALFPVSQVSASLGEQDVTVNALGNQNYSVEVNKNGYLLLEVVSISGVRATQSVTIDSIDDQAPVIVSHSHKENSIFIYAKDIGASGIDYGNIYASTKSSGIIRPDSCDSQNGLIIFPYPSEDMYITIPDRNGNKIISVLSPGKTD